MKLLFVIENVERYLFFQPIAQKIQSTHSIEFITNNKFIFHLLKRQSSTHLYSPPEPTLNTESYDRIIVWNGNDDFSKAITTLADREKVRFWELSNLPNKIQSSKYGINAKSELFSKPSLLDSKPDVSNKQHQDWLESYYQDKANPPKQSRASVKKMAYLFIGYIIHPKSFTMNTIENIKSLVLKKELIKDIPTLDRLPGKFILFPCQVSNDTQITENSNTNNIEAINTAYKIATEKKLSLVVKIHPAENSLEEIQQIKKTCKTLNAIVCANNTVQLLKACSEVITINSTVGLEGLIFNKPVKALGKAIYSDFDQHRLKKYIHHYLISGIDYFNPRQASLESIIRAIQ